MANFTLVVAFEIEASAEVAAKLKTAMQEQLDTGMLQAELTEAPSAPDTGWTIKGADAYVTRCPATRLASLLSDK